MVFVVGTLWAKKWVPCNQLVNQLGNKDRWVAPKNVSDTRLLLKDCYAS
ncbi:Hypothetical protein CulFRC58_1620 [Corynebacterium ulcerans FRC58]|uniref:Transposase n=1 Tax=Corynebacterium ulcerans FRC58 TaxID=1408268 RepID=A0ABM5U1X0_CORUL|nr:Hypothetical protein CulFRC58_1620 [Corynebacterium ulcerans FRC58]